MTESQRRIVGLVVAAAAALSLLVSLVAVVQVWRVRGQVTSQVVSVLDQASGTLATTGEALDVAEGALRTATRNLDTLETTVLAIASTLDETRQAVGGAAEIVEADLPASIDATRTAVRSAQTTAGALDDFLARLARVPVVGSAAATYRPQVPLATSLEQVGDSLEDLPAAVTDVGAMLGGTGESLDDVSAQVSALGSDVREINRSIAGAHDVIASYQDQLAAYQETVADLQATAPGWVTLGALGATWVLLWLAVLQAWFLAKGLAWAGHALRSPAGSTDGGADDGEVGAA